MDTLKGLLRSKTFWFNIATGAVEVVNFLAPVLPPGVVTGVGVIGNIILRAVTTEPLKAKVK